MVAQSPNQGIGEQRDGDAGSNEGVFESLVHRRRRDAIRCLAADGESMPVRTLAHVIAQRERDEPGTGILTAEAEAVHTTLYHQHVPKLVDAGTVEFDREHELVSLTPEGKRAQQVLAFATDGDAEH